MIFVEGLDDLLDVLKQMAPVLVLLSTTAILWWRSAHVARCELGGSRRGRRTRIRSAATPRSTSALWSLLRARLKPVTAS